MKVRRPHASKDLACWGVYLHRSSLRSPSFRFGVQACEFRVQVCVAKVDQSMQQLVCTNRTAPLFVKTMLCKLIDAATDEGSRKCTWSSISLRASIHCRRWILAGRASASSNDALYTQMIAAENSG